MSLISQANLTTDDTFTPPLRLAGWTPHLGARPFDVCVQGVFTGTLSLQISHDDGETWGDTGDYFTAPGADTGSVATACLVRCGFKTGDYASGAATVRIAQ